MWESEACWLVSAKCGISISLKLVHLKHFQNNLSPRDVIKPLLIWHTLQGSIKGNVWFVFAFPHKRDIFGNIWTEAHWVKLWKGISHVGRKSIIHFVAWRVEHRPDSSRRSCEIKGGYVSHVYSVPLFKLNSAKQSLCSYQKHFDTAELVMLMLIGLIRSRAAVQEAPGTAWNKICSSVRKDICRCWFTSKPQTPFN